MSPDASSTSASVAAATLDNFDDLVPLFEKYPYKEIQRKVQKLDAARLRSFYAEGLRRGLTGGAPHWFARLGNETVALAGLHDDAWHSGVYGMKMAKIAPWLNVLRPDAGAALLDAVENETRARGHEHLSVRIDGEDYVNLHLFESRGWRLVDVSLKFNLALPLVGPSFSPPSAQAWRIEAAGETDRDWMAKLSVEHAATHFRNDPSLPAEKTDELFARWVEKCANGLAWRIDVLRAEDQTAGAGAAFVIWLRGESFAKAVGRRPLILDFLLLDPARRGGGLGPWFAAEALRAMAGEGFDFCELRTSSHNQPAIACYEKIGFRCCASDFVLHKEL